MEKQDGAESSKIVDSSGCNTEIVIDKDGEADNAVIKEDDGEVSRVIGFARESECMN